MKLWFVDAFTDKAFHGNPAAVTIVEEFPADDFCQALAAEINLSETAFVKPLDANHFHIRWFTPATEVKLCGHATLAASHVLQSTGLIDQPQITFNSLSGPLHVNCDSQNSYTLNFPLQATGPALDHKLFEPLLGIRSQHIVQAYDDIIIELNDVQDVIDFIPNRQKLSEIDCRGIIITAQSDGPYDFISRFFAPKVGVLEDPVTGSAHCKLAHYWQQRLNKQQFRAYQASSRGGSLQLVIHGPRLLISGQAILTMQADWLIT